MSEPSRRYPQRPILAVSAAIFRGDRVLLAARGHEPMRGIFTLPGGAVEPGETLIAAARREVAEEVGLDIAVAGFVAHQEVIRWDAEGRVEHHFVIAVFAARWTRGEPRQSEEASGFRWADVISLGGLPVTDGLHGIVAKAQQVLRTGS